MSDDTELADRLRAAHEQRGQPVTFLQGRPNGQGGLPMAESSEARERRLAKAMWWESTAWTEALIPQRRWIARPLLLRGTVTALAGPGSGGKSSLMLGWAVALACGLDYHPLRPSAPVRVLVYNCEDDSEEQQRRLSATLRQFDRCPADIAGRIMRCGPRNVGTLIEYDSVAGHYVFTEAWEALEYLLDQHHPDVVMLDPLVELHGAEENDNTALRAVLARFRVLAISHDCAVVLIHHSRKGATAGDVDGIRGASSLIGASRIVLTVFPMTPEEAEGFALPAETRRQYFRVDAVKQNYAATSRTIWHELTEYELDNGELVAAAVPWKPPSPWQGMSIPDCNALLDLIDAGLPTGQRYTRHRQRGNAHGDADRWVVPLIMRERGVSEIQALQIAMQWLHHGLLVEEKYEDLVARKERIGLRVMATKKPGPC